MLNELTRNDVGPLTAAATGTGLGPISPYSSEPLLVPATARAVPPRTVPRTSAATDQLRVRFLRTVGKPVMCSSEDREWRQSSVPRPSVDAQLPHWSQFSQTHSHPRPARTNATVHRSRPLCRHLDDGAEPAEVGSRPQYVKKRHTVGMTRIPAAVAGL